jgi:SsrA-binding protein
MGEKIVVQNKRARREYHILEKFEAGLELRGTEVKSLRAGHMSLQESYVGVERGQIYLTGAHISPYEQGNINNHDSDRARRLLMHKREIVRLGQIVAEKGLTLVPLKVYFKQGRAKIEIALCRGKHTVDKRQTLRDREVQRDMERAIKSLRHS